MNAYLLGIGKAVPANSFTQIEAAGHALTVSPVTGKKEDSIPLLYQRAGVESRGLVVLEKSDGKVSIPFYPPASALDAKGPTTEERMKEYADKAPALAVEACRNALNDSGIDAGKIRHLVTVTCTGFSSPGFDLEIIKQLKLSSGVSRTQIGFMGCHGAINGLRASHALAAANPEEAVLLCSAEISSVHYAYGWKSHQVVANSLFADGAGAAVISSIPSAEKKSWRIHSTASVIFPDSEDAMTWKIGDHGFEMGLSPRVPALIKGNLGPWLSGWLSGQGLNIEDIRTWAVHPGGPRILDAVEETLNLSKNALSVPRKILSENGNMSSATLFSVFGELRSQNAPLPCVSLAFGPGLAGEAALFV